MKKTPDRIREEIMLQLYGNRPLSRTAENIVSLARRENAEMHDLTDFEVTREAWVLAGLGRIRRLEGADRWDITAAGVLWMEQEGLV